MEIHLIRHGKTSANEKRLYCGKTDIPLSKSGIQGIKYLKQKDIYPKDIDLLFTSGLVRTKETATLIYGTAHAEVIPELEEFNFGQFEMKSYEQLKEKPHYQAWISDSDGIVICPGGESRKQFLERILIGYNTILQKSEKAESVLLVSHGGVIACIMDYLFPDVCNFYEWKPEVGRGYTIYKSNIHNEYKRI